MVAGQHARRRTRGLAATAATSLLVLAGVVSLGAGLGSAAPDQPPLSAGAGRAVAPPAPEPALARARLGAPLPATPSGPVLPASTPVGLSIPAIDVNSPLLLLGLEADGTLEVPPPGPTYDSAGWFQHSPTPGQLGPAVLAGHVDSAAHGPSVFYRLVDLVAGDEVLVDRADGSTAVFRVDDVRRYGKTDFPTDLVYGDTDHAALRLITCGGSFDRTTGHYLDNVVVMATLTGSRT